PKDADKDKDTLFSLDKLTGLGQDVATNAAGIGDAAGSSAMAALGLGTAFSLGVTFNKEAGRDAWAHISLGHKGTISPTVPGLVEINIAKGDRLAQIDLLPTFKIVKPELLVKVVEWAKAKKTKKAA
ncbi:MAG: hypothetical protein ACRD0J_16065, partial [Acidimicrobiales bacterium]